MNGKRIKNKKIKIILWLQEIIIELLYLLNLF